jgi:hypothetical protein
VGAMLQDPGNAECDIDRLAGTRSGSGPARRRLSLRSDIEFGLENGPHRRLGPVDPGTQGARRDTEDCAGVGVVESP